MRSDRRTTLIAVIIAALTFIAYLPALQNGFVNWDDQEYVNEGLRAFPIGLEYLKWVFSTPVCANWHPLTVLSHTAITKIWGLNPLPHILVNIIFHSLNTFLVALLAVKLIALGATFPGMASAEGRCMRAPRPPCCSAFTRSM